MIVIPILPIIPLLFYLADGYYEKNLKKGLAHIIVFLVAALVMVSMLYILGWAFALCTPLLLFVLLMIKPKNRSEHLNRNQQA